MFMFLADVLTRHSREGSAINNNITNGSIVYLLLYGGQQVFENSQLGHEVLQLLVTTLIH